MHKLILYILFLQLVFTSCEEIYQPKMDTISGLLVVDAEITNELSKNYVHLSKTRSFYDNLPVIEVSGATVNLIELGGRVIKGHENSPGYYSFNEVPLSGKQYFLRIVNMNRTYESKAVTMPTLPSITDFYTTHVEKTVIVKTGENNNLTYKSMARAIDVDLPMTDSLSHYRFVFRSLLQWTWEINPASPAPYPICYGWYSYQNNELFQLVGPKDMTEPGKVTMHQLGSISYDSISTLHKDTLTMRGWILFVEQYGISKESYEFHKQLNNQFAATGSLFDPIQTQVYGNILCKSNPTETVYGFFDLNSFQQVRYFLTLNKPPGAISLRRIYRYPIIPDHGVIYGIMGELPIKPSWWEE
jgi:hypothetical protein